MQFLSFNNRWLKQNRYTILRNKFASRSLTIIVSMHMNIFWVWSVMVYLASQILPPKNTLQNVSAVIGAKKRRSLR